MTATTVTIEDDLKEGILELLNDLDSAWPESKELISNSLKGIVDPVEVSTKAAQAWLIFLNIAIEHKSDLRAFVFPVGAATGMQMLYTRLAILWERLEHDPTGLNPVLLSTVDREVSTYIGLIAH